MITILYAGLLGLLYVGLSYAVVRGRIGNRLAFGDGGNPDMIKRIRAHGNFAEYVPFALLLIFLVDYSHFQPLIVHLLGIALVIARILHAVGIYKDIFRARVTGMVITMLVFLTSSVLLLVHFAVMLATGFN